LRFVLKLKGTQTLFLFIDFHYRQLCVGNCQALTAALPISHTAFNLTCL